MCLGGCGGGRGVSGAGRRVRMILTAWAAGQGEGLPEGWAAPVGPLGPIKRKATFAARWGARYPAACGAPESPLADFGSVSGWARRVVARGLGSAGRSAGPIKKKQRERRGRVRGFSRGE